MKKNGIIFLVLLFGFVMVSYQNCSKVDFKANKPSSEIASTPADGLDGSEDLPSDGSGDSSTDGVDGGAGSDGGTDVGDGPDGDTDGGDGSGGDTPPQTDDELAETLRKTCSDLANGELAALTPLPSGSTLKNLKGKSHYIAEDLELISNVGGNAYIASFLNEEMENFSINEIRDSNGNITLCGFNVGTVSGGTNGSLYIVDGDVEHIENHKGNITIVGGKYLGDPNPDLNLEVIE